MTCLYVDNLLIFGSSIQALNDVKSLLCNKSDMKDIREANIILGINITRFEKGISLDQSHNMDNILKKNNYFDAKLAFTPYNHSANLFKKNVESVIQTEYESIIGSLRYATDCTRSNIAYVVGLLSSFTSRPNNEHGKVIERVA